MIRVLYVDLKMMISTVVLASEEVIFLVAAVSFMKVCISSSTMGSIAGPYTLAMSWTRLQPSLERLVRSELTALRIPSSSALSPERN
jgi:hypothetical protein